MPDWRHVRYFLLFAIIFVCCEKHVYGQNKFVRDYFLFPFNPGVTNYLSGSMGELRTNHFHGGIDIKTAAKVGLPILASADGYVSRVKVSSYSYGNVVYITHPNGYVTVYAHLDRFNKAIGDFVREAQYKAESFEVDLVPASSDLPTKKGEVIGLSGNSGSSGGPHLHYEVRDQNDRLYNPLMFGFSEIKDNLAPSFDKLAIRTFDSKSRVNNEFGRYEFTAVRQGKNFVIPQTITATGVLGLEVKVYDRMNFTSNLYGVTCIEVRVDGKEKFYHNITTLPFEDHRYINAHMDYETYVKRNRRFEKCYVADGNKLSTYKQDITNGKIFVNDTLRHKVELFIYDAYSNVSTLTFFIKGQKLMVPALGIVPAKVSAEVTSELFENILKVRCKAETRNQLQVYIKGLEATFMPDYFKSGSAFYLYDLRKGLPDSIRVNNKTRNLDFKQMVPSGVNFTYKYKNFRINFPYNSVFDTLYLQFSQQKGLQGEEIFKLSDPTISFYKSPEIVIAPNASVPDKAHTYIYNINKYPLFEGGNWNKEEISFSPKYLGKFTYYSDLTDPTIRYITRTVKSVRFTIFDSNSGIEGFKATLNGKWILMNYDHKRRLLWAEGKDPEENLQGEFLLSVTDRCGNTATYKTILQ